MNYIRHLNAFFSFVRSDKRLTSSHVSLYLALFYYWNFNRFNNPFAIYRENILQVSKLSKNTYHKAIKELHEAQYIIYHPAPSRFHVVRITVIRLDVPEEPKSKFRQLDLFSYDETTGRKIETVSVSNSSPNNTNIDTGTVAELRHSLKQTNKHQNSVDNSHTKKFEKKSVIQEKINISSSVANVRHMPALIQVEQFFKENKYSGKEAHKFFYYNQGKNWMLTDKIPIYDWKAIAHKWMLNVKDHPKQEPVIDLDKDIQYLYERFLEGENISKYILTEYSDHLQLQPPEEVIQNAKRRRINQLTGSNEHSETQLWFAYTGETNNPELVEKDYPKVLAIAKRLSVYQFFEQLKLQGKTCIQ